MDITDTLSGYIGYTIYRYSDKGSDAFDDDYDEFNIGFSYAVSDDFSVSLDYANGENTAVGGTETDYDVGTITFDYLGLTLTVGDWGIGRKTILVRQMQAGGNLAMVQQLVILIYQALSYSLKKS